MANEAEFMDLYQAWQRLPSGPRAELRRCGTLDDLLEVPAFYRLLGGRFEKEWQKKAFQRLVFCLPCIKGHTEQKISLGAALARSRNGARPVVSESRMIQIVRCTSPNDMIQLRRILKQAEPTVNWPLMAKQLWYWNYSERSKRDLLEDFFINQKDKSKEC
jgi:CRISPR system Cascade subunit CasB